MRVSNRSPNPENPSRLSLLKPETEADQEGEALMQICKQEKEKEHIMQNQSKFSLQSPDLPRNQKKLSTFHPMMGRTTRNQVESNLPLLGDLQRN